MIIDPEEFNRLIASAEHAIEQHPGQVANSTQIEQALRAWLEQGVITPSSTHRKANVPQPTEEGQASLGDGGTGKFGYPETIESLIADRDGFQRRVGELENELLRVHRRHREELLALVRDVRQDILDLLDRLKYADSGQQRYNAALGDVRAYIDMKQREDS